MKLLSAFILLTISLLGQTRDLAPRRLFSGTVSALPASCVVGQVYFATNATAGQNLYFCTATNTWTQQLNTGGGGGGGNSPFVSTTDHANNIAASIAALTSGVGTVVVNANVTVGVVTAVPSNVTVWCLPGVTITETNPAVNVFDMSGSSHSTITGCTMTGGSNGVFGSGMNFDTVSRNDISGFVNYGFVSGPTNFNFQITGNYIHDGLANSADPIFIEDPGATVTIADNMAVSAAGNVNTHGIAVHTSAVGGEARGVMVRGNFIFQSGGNFALEVGKFNSGNAPFGCQVTGNSIIVSVAGSAGGISLDTTGNCVVSGNDVSLSGNLPGIAGIEIVKSTNTIVDSNQVRNTPANGNAFSINRSSRTIFTNNNMQGYGFIENSGPTNLDLSDNRLEHNIFTMPGGSTNLPLIKMQCNFAGCTASRNSISNNTFMGNSLGSSVTVKLEQDIGVIDGTQLSNNTVVGFPSSYDIGGGVTNTILGLTLSNAGLTYTGTQIIPAGSAAPTIVNGAAAGTAPGVPTVTGFNMDGIVTVITGTATVTGTLATVTFNGTLPVAPLGCALYPRNSIAAAQMGVIFTGAPSTTTWTIAAGVGAVPVSTTFIWSYHCE